MRFCLASALLVVASTALLTNKAPSVRNTLLVPPLYLSGSSVSFDEVSCDTNEKLATFEIGADSDVSSSRKLPTAVAAKAAVAIAWLTNPSLRWLKSLVASTFLPAGFPHSVPREYAAFQRWNLLQDLCSYLRNIMSTRALLEGMGVGRADVPPPPAPPAVLAPTP